MSTFDNISTFNNVSITDRDRRRITVEREIDTDEEVPSPGYLYKDRRSHLIQRNERLLSL